MRFDTLRAQAELAGMEIEGADLAIRADREVSYGVPSEIAIVSASELRSPAIIKPGPERLAWPWVNDGGPVLTYKWLDLKHVSPRKGKCLDAFIRLMDVREDRFPQAVLDFARRWGPLEICEHRKPQNHRDLADPPCQSFSTGRGQRTEPVEAWRRYSRQLRAILLVAANLHQDRPGDKADWADVERGEPEGISIEDHYYWGPGEIAGNVIHERQTVALALERWFRYGQVGLSPQWLTRRNAKEHWFEIQTAYWRLAGRLAVDLAAALRSPNGLYRCAGCGRPFTPKKRRRARNREKWCESEECKSEQYRRNSKRYYERKFKAKPKLRKTVKKGET